MASMKMCKQQPAPPAPAHRACGPCAVPEKKQPAPPAPAHGACGPCAVPEKKQPAPPAPAHGACGPCAAPEKKQHHFWPYKHGNDHHEPAKHGNDHHEAAKHHKLTGCFRPNGGELNHANGYGYCESDEITIVRTEKKEEHVSVIHVKNKSKQHC